MEAQRNGERRNGGLSSLDAKCYRFIKDNDLFDEIESAGGSDFSIFGDLRKKSK